MDPDSFLDLLSPGFNDLDIVWGSPADTDPYSFHAPPLAWLTDAFINSTDGGEEEEDEEVSEGHLLATKRPTSTSSASALDSSILSNASEYSSVLKLSDIASALHNFSKATGLGGTHRRALSQKLSPAQSTSSVSHSPTHPESSFVKRSPLPSVSALNNSSSSGYLMQSGSFEVNGTKLSGDASGNNLGLHAQAVETESQGPDETEANNKHSSDAVAVNEKECSSKLTSDGLDGFNVFDNEYDEEEEGDDDSSYYEDVKPCVSHVRIIRRPYSNCGQPSPKRVKLAHVKAEATSSCEMASMQDDKDGASSLKQMRKEGMSQREVHILSERQRRKSMRESFSILQSLVPKLKLKHTDRITVLTEVITYIQSLRGTLEELERKKADMMELLGLSAKSKSPRHDNDMQGTITYINSNDNGSSDEKGERSGGWCSMQNGERVAMVEVTVRMCGADVFVTLNTPQRRGVWSGVLSLLQKFSIEVSNATLATTGDSSFHCIHAKATDLSCVEGVDLQEKLEGVIVKELRRPARKGHS